jgi:multidrug efflux pump subunit AcrA (membrane-fusion protein)
MSEATHNIATVIKMLFARLRFVAIFVVAGLVVGYWDNIKNHVDKWTRPAIAPDSLSHVSNIEFYCPMHPHIRQETPGKCPICSMELVKRIKGKQEKLPDDVLARIQLSPQRIALANLATSPVEYRRLSREVHALGMLDYNETKISQISARVAGRVDELFVKSVGEAVKQGSPVYSLYSPEVFTAQREYLLARARANELAKEGTAEGRADASAVYNAAMQKLVLWGLSMEQLEELEMAYDASGKVPTHFNVSSPISGIVVKKDVTEGRYLQVGESAFTVADLKTLWLKARLFEEDISLVKKGDVVDVVVRAYPERTYSGTVTFLAYQVDPETRTLDARIEVANPGLVLRPGMFADAIIRVPVSDGSAATAPATQAVPATAPAAPGIANARVYYEALTPYLKAQKLLATDKSSGVSDLLHETLSRLAPLKENADVKGDYELLANAIHRTMGQEIEPLRTTFKEVSLAMIRIGRTTGVPTEANPIDILRCPMTDKPNWLQEKGATMNPYYGSKMLDCGGPIGALPKVAMETVPTTRPARPVGKVLAIPRTAVIDTGRQKIVYVQSADGVYDMRAIKVGPLAGDYFPILSGLEENDKVVTTGAFLLDAENTLNPR